MQKPPTLKKGDKIGIVSPAGVIASEKIQAAIKKIEEWGLKIVLGKHIFSKYHQFAGKIKERQSDMQKMLDDKTIKAIICTRGGYGCIQTIENLNFEKFKKSPKWIVGFSDITVFHAYLNHVLGFESLHATMPVNFIINSNEALASLHDSLMAETPKYKIKPHKFNRKGNAKGRIFGGNLAVICSLQGTNMEIETKNKILFIEDIGEELFRLDRMIMTLKTAGKLAEINGLIVGGMTDMIPGNPDFGKTAYEIISETVSKYNYPVVFNFPSGHMSDNRALPLGRVLNLKVTNNEVILEWDTSPTLNNHY